MYQENERQFDIEIPNPHQYTRNIEINIPAGYKVNNLDKLNMNVVGRTNQLVVIPRKDLDGLVRISAPGCETKELMLPLKTTPATWLDIPWILVPYGSVFYDTDVAFGSDIATENEINVELNCK